MKRNLRIFAVMIVALSLLHAILTEFGGVNIAGLVFGFLLLLYAFLHKEKPSPAPVMPKLEMPKSKAQPELV